MKKGLYGLFILLFLLVGCSDESKGEKITDEPKSPEEKSEEIETATWIKDWIVNDWKTEFEPFLSTRPTLGDKEAPIVFAQISNFDCEYCIQWNQEIFPWLKEEYIDKGIVQITYISLPSEEEYSQNTSRLGLGIYNQNETSFWDYYTSLYERPRLTNENLLLLADSVEPIVLNQEENEEITTMLEENKVFASEHQVSKLPTFNVNGYRLDYPFDKEKIKEFLDEMLKFYRQNKEKAVE